MNDDGEPSSTAGKPIYGQLISRNITNCLIVVVRYFGGTKLGVSGLITAYKECAAELIDASEIIERTVDVVFTISFSYIVMNDVMKIIKDEQPKIESQDFNNLCSMNLSIRKGSSDMLRGKLDKVEGCIIEQER